MKTTMAATGRWLLGALLLAPAPARLGAQEPAPVLVIRNASVLDGSGGPVRRNVSIRVDGDRITAVQSGVPTDLPGARVIDGRGLTVTPGLSDLHVHLGEPTRAAWILKTLLSYGITRVRDTGNDLASLRGITAWMRTDTLLPRLYRSGEEFDGSRTELRFLRAGAELEAQLAENLAFGIDFLKVHNWVSWNALLRIAKASRDNGIPLTGHVPLNVSSIAAIDAGFRILEHVRVHPFELFDDPAVNAGYPLDVLLLKRIGYWSRFTGRDRMTSATIAGWKARRDRFFLDPTLVVHEALGLGLAGLPRLDAETIVSPALWQEWPGTLPRFGRLTPAEAVEARGAAAGMGRFVGLVHRQGVRILTGTDAPLPGTPPGSSLWRELELLVEAGLTPAEAIHASTGQASAALGASDVGLVAPGQRADLALFRGDLARDISAVSRLEHVVLGGVVLDPAVLRREARALARADSIPHR